MTQGSSASASLESVAPNMADICIAKYLNDLWVFDTQEYKWTLIELRENENKPSCVLFMISRADHVDTSFLDLAAASLSYPHLMV